MRKKIERYLNLDMTKLNLPADTKPFPWPEAIYFYLITYPLSAAAMGLFGAAVMTLATLTVVWW
ncbi:MAG: hypothetical protein HY804_08900 [Nitrospinae bacterium]|nr:hypothetical protein [Nitrospinota bacterium]